MTRVGFVGFIDNRRHEHVLVGLAIRLVNDRKYALREPKSITTAVICIAALLTKIISLATKARDEKIQRI